MPKFEHYPLSIIHAKRPSLSRTGNPSRTPHSDKLLSTRQFQDAQRVSFKRTTQTGPLRPSVIACINQRPLKSRSRSGLPAVLSPFAFSNLLCCDPSDVKARNHRVHTNVEARVVLRQDAHPVSAFLGLGFPSSSSYT